MWEARHQIGPRPWACSVTAKETFMKWWAVAGVVALGIASEAGAAEKEPRWLTDFDKAQAAARATGKPIFLVFR
jgi:hypothetical protein